MFLWVLLATLANYLNLMRGLWEPPIYSQLVRSTGNNLNLQLVSKVGPVLWDWVLTLWDLILSPDRQCQNWVKFVLIVHLVSVSWENCLVVWKKKNTLKWVKNTDDYANTTVIIIAGKNHLWIPKLVDGSIKKIFEQCLRISPHDTF